MKSWPELIGSGNPEAHDYAAGLKEELNAAYKEADKGMKAAFIAPPESMVDRVALAIHSRMKAHEKEYVGKFNELWGTATHVGDGFFDLNEVARAAIEAMREIPPSMYDNYRCDRLWRNLDSVKVWELWIDAALKE